MPMCTCSTIEFLGAIRTTIIVRPAHGLDRHHRRHAGTRCSHVAARRTPCAQPVLLRSTPLVVHGHPWSPQGRAACPSVGVAASQKRYRSPVTRGTLARVQSAALPLAVPEPEALPVAASAVVLAVCAARAPAGDA